MNKALFDEVHRQRGRDVVFWRDVSTAEPGPWILGRATHAILGGEKLLWGEAGLEVFRPKLARVRGRSCVSLPVPVSPLPACQLRIDGLWGPQHRRIVASG